MDQDDVVVQELDVYLCNGILGATQVICAKATVKSFTIVSSCAFPRQLACCDFRRSI